MLVCILLKHMKFRNESREKKSNLCEQPILTKSRSNMLKNDIIINYVFARCRIIKKGVRNTFVYRIRR